MATSSVAALKQQTGLAPAEKKPQTFASLLEAMKPEFAKVLPRAMSAERLIRIATTNMRHSERHRQHHDRCATWPRARSDGSILPSSI